MHAHLAIDHLGEVTYLATLLVDQIEWVDVVYAPDNSFRRTASDVIRSGRSRDALKQIIERISTRMRLDPLAMKLMDPEPVIAAAGMVEAAVKGLLKTGGNGRQFLAGKRLIIKFESLDDQWIEDPKKDPVRMAASLFVPGSE